MEEKPTTSNPLKMLRCRQKQNRRNICWDPTKVAAQRILKATIRRQRKHDELVAHANGIIDNSLKIIKEIYCYWDQMLKIDQQITRAHHHLIFLLAQNAKNVEFIHLMQEMYHGYQESKSLNHYQPIIAALHEITNGLVRIKDQIFFHGYPTAGLALLCYSFRNVVRDLYNLGLQYKEMRENSRGVQNSYGLVITLCGASWA